MFIVGESQLCYILLLSIQNLKINFHEFSLWGPDPADFQVQLEMSTIFPCSKQQVFVKGLLSTHGSEICKEHMAGQLEHPSREHLTRSSSYIGLVTQDPSFCPKASPIYQCMRIEGFYIHLILEIMSLSTSGKQQSKHLDFLTLVRTQLIESYHLLNCTLQ